MRADATYVERACHVNATGALAVAIDITKAISLIDVSNTARRAGDEGSATAALDRARHLLLALIGIVP